MSCMNYALVVSPTLHRDKVRQKAGNVTFEKDIISPYDVLLIHVRLVILHNHCKWTI